jgi:outer membrane protein assembly factor BamB
MRVQLGRSMSKLYLFTLTLIIGLGAPSDSRGQNAADQLPVSKCWEAGHDDDIIVDAETGDGIIIVALRSGRLIGKSLAGQTLWLTDIGGVIDSNLVVAGNSIFLVSKPVSVGTDPPGEAALREFSGQTGLPVFSVSLGKGEKWKLVSVKKNLLLINDRKISYLSLPEKRLLWERAFDSDESEVLTIGDEAIWAGGKDGSLFSISIADGSDLIKLPSQNTQITAGIVSSHLILGDDTGVVRAIARTNGDRSWHFRTGGRISHLLATGGLIIAGSNDNHIYAFDGKKGFLRWKRRLGGRIEILSLMSGDHLLARAIGDNHWEMIETSTGRLAGRVDPAGSGRNAFKGVVFGSKGFGLVSLRGMAGYSLSGC